MLNRSGHLNIPKKPFFVLACLLALSACSDPEAPAGPGGMQMPPPEVDVAEVVLQEQKDWKEFTGRLEATDSIVVKPRTSGYVVSVEFEDGALVKKGDLLFQIDFRTIKAEVERLEAEVERADAEIALTERDLKRANSLREKNAISQEQLDNRRTQLTQAKATAESARAELKRSKVLYAITKVKAPFDGRVSNARVKEGSSVVAGQTELTSLVSTDKVHAYFDVDEYTYLTLRSRYPDISHSGLTVQMGLAHQKDFPYQGTVDFVDNQVDIATGTIRMRAVYENPEGDLTPGLFVRLKMQIGPAYQTVMIPDKAIGTDLSNKFVLVLGEGDVVSYRPVQLGSRRGDWRIIKSGLEVGERIVINGLQRARPGAPVSPNVLTMDVAEQG